MNTVTVRELARHTATVLDRAAAGERITITRDGRPVAVLTAPSEDETAMDELVAAGRAPAGWRDRSQRLLRLLAEEPPTWDTASGRSLTESALEMRDEEGR